MLSLSRLIQADDILPKKEKGRLICWNQRWRARMLSSNWITDPQVWLVLYGRTPSISSATFPPVVQ